MKSLINQTELCQGASWFNCLNTTITRNASIHSKLKVESNGKYSGADKYSLVAFTLDINSCSLCLNMLLNGWKEQEMKLTQSTQNQAPLVSWRRSVPPNVKPATCPSALTQEGETVSEKEWGSVKWEIPETHGDQCQLWSKWYLFIASL